jgi:hypothetical protein
MLSSAQVVLYYIADLMNTKWLKLILLALLISCYLFVIPKHVLPEGKGETACGLSVIPMLFLTILGGGITAIAVHIGHWVALRRKKKGLT